MHAVRQNHVSCIYHGVPYLLQLLVASDMFKCFKPIHSSLRCLLRSYSHPCTSAQYAGLCNVAEPSSMDCRCKRGKVFQIPIRLLS